MSKAPKFSGEGVPRSETGLMPSFSTRLLLFFGFGAAERVCQGWSDWRVLWTHH